MDDALLQCAGVASLAVVDLTLALCCGLLWTGIWLPRAEIRLPRIAWPAAALIAGLCARFYVLTATMVQDARPAAVFAGASGVAATHAGAMTVWSLAAACVVLVANLGSRRAAAWPAWVMAAPLVALLALHAGMGHAADSGNFTLDELWQFMHLAAMATWAGSVMAAGFFAAPRLFAATSQLDAAYLRKLSWASTWSVVVVVLSGSARAWTGLDGHLGNLLPSRWGWILLAKLTLVCVALALGYLHRRAIHGPGRWTVEKSRWLVGTMRIEAACLAIVLVLSAWLGSADLPGSM